MKRLPIPYIRHGVAQNNIEVAFIKEFRKILTMNKYKLRKAVLITIEKI